MKRIIVSVVCLFILPWFSPGISYGDSAMVLPKGRFSSGMEFKFYNATGDRYNEKREWEPLDFDYNVEFTSNIFIDLEALDPITDILGLGLANLGRSVVDYEFSRKRYDYYFAYGLTDNLSIGLFLPIGRFRNHVTAELVPTDANLGKNPAFNPNLPISGANPAFIPTVPNPFFPGLVGVPLDTEDAQNFMGLGIDIDGDGQITDHERDLGYGFERVKNHRQEGIMDIELGAKYKYLETDDFRLAAGFGWRIPSGKVDNPDSLVDIGFGEGAHALTFRLYNDYKGLKNFLFNATLRYEVYLPDKELLRVPDDINVPLTRNKEDVERDIGDSIGIEVSGTYTFFKCFSIRALYDYWAKAHNKVSGKEGFVYESLEVESDAMTQVYRIDFGFSTIPLFLEKKFPVPMEILVGYYNRFAGESISRAEITSLNLRFYW